jgi:hypothetical protein
VGYYAHDVVRKSIVTQIKFTDLKTILFFLGIKENEFSK